jgi:hypothetical protein
MNERVQGCVTAGVVMVGAGALALAPMAPQTTLQLRADQVRTVDVSDMKLMATVTPTPASLLAALQILATGANTPADTSGGVAGSVQRLAGDTLQGLLGPIALVQALGNEAQTDAILESYIDAPLHIADPTIFAINNVLPAPYGGGDYSIDPRYRDDSDVLAFRANVLYVLREELKQALGLPSALDASTEQTVNAELVAPSDPTLPDVSGETVGDPVFTVSRLAQGLGFSAERLVESSLQGAAAPITAAQAIAGGAPVNVVLKNVIDAAIDAPAYIADPTVFAIDDVLPAPIGSDPSRDKTDMSGSAVSQFRANVILKTRDAIKAPIDAALTSGGGAVTANKTAVAGVNAASTTTSTTGKHRATVNNPVSSALKKLAKDVKKASTPKHAAD